MVMIGLVWLQFNLTLFLPPQLFTNNGKKTLDTTTRLTAGALAGITSVCPSDPSIYFFIISITFFLIFPWDSRHHISPGPRKIKVVDCNRINTSTAQYAANRFHAATFTGVWIPHRFNSIIINTSPYDEACRLDAQRPHNVGNDAQSHARRGRSSGTLSWDDTHSGGCGPICGHKLCGL